LRSEWRLCNEVGFEPGTYMRRFVPGGVVKLSYHPYEVMETRTIRVPFTPKLRKGAPTVEWRAGDVAVRLMWQECPAIEKCVIESQGNPARPFGEGCRTFKYCNKYPAPYTYIVRKSAHRWVMVVYYQESRQRDLQGDFWNR
jgi:hypothetical protein